MGDAGDTSDSGSDDSVGPLVAPLQADANIGASLMSKMGWTVGQGLGATGQGRLEPIETVVRAKYAGLRTAPAIESPPDPQINQGRVLKLTPKPSEPPGLRSLRAQLSRTQDLHQAAIDARDIIVNGPSTDIQSFYIQFSAWWAEPSLQNELQNAASVLLVKRIRHLQLDPLNPLLLRTLRDGRQVLNMSLWKRVILSEWLPLVCPIDAHGDLEDEDSLLLAVEAWPFLLDAVDEHVSSQISVPGDLDRLSRWLAILTSPARRLLINRYIHWITDTFDPTDPAFTNTYDVCERLSEEGIDLDTALVPLLVDWAAKLDPYDPVSLVHIGPWCGPVSPDVLVQRVLEPQIFPRWLEHLAVVAIKRGASWWHEWRQSLPRSLQTHPIVLWWIHVGLCFINSHLDGCVLPTITRRRPRQAGGETRASFKDVVYAFCVDNNIPMDIDPLRIRGVPARIADDVLYLLLKDRWEAVALDALLN